MLKSEDWEIVTLQKSKEQDVIEKYTYLMNAQFFDM